VFGFYRSTIGKKIIMAVTGLIGIGFVILHMAGNLQVFVGAEKINAYGALLHRAECLRYTGGRAGRSTRIAFKDVSTRIEGDVAVVTGINELTGAGVRDVGDGAALVIRFTQVWTWKDGRWQREAFQATPVAQIAQFT
jgi:ketosteroid isomerase-like protein